MRYLLVLALLAVAIPVSARDLPPDKLFRRASPSVVQVAVPLGSGQVGNGSGVMVRDPRFGPVIVTNCHVLGKATQAFVKDTAGEVVSSRIVARDRPRDLCLLRPDDLDRLSTRPAELARVKDLEVGDRVYAIGAPHGFDLTLTDGLVSGFRDLGGARLIQSTAPISHGSSGGGLFDARGRLVGVTTMFLANSQALNFAVPVSLLSELVPYAPGRPEPVGPAFPQWRVLHSSDMEEFALDAGSIRGDQGVVSLWTRYSTTHPRTVPGVERPVAHTVAHYQIYCATRQWWFDEYVLSDLRNQVIEAGTIEKEAREDIKDGTFGHFLHANLCSAED